MSRPDSIQSRVHRLVLGVSVISLIALVAMLGLLIVRNNQYSSLLYNVTTASEFNQDFKDNINLKMYYYVINSQYSEGLPIDEVAAAQKLARDLSGTTSNKDSLQAITSVQNLCENLEEKIDQIRRTENYDDRKNQLENNVYVLTALIEEYMYNYLYFESAQLNVLQEQINRQLVIEVLLAAVFILALIVTVSRRSIRLVQSVTIPIMKLCQRAQDVTGGDLTVREPVPSDIYEIRTLGEGIEHMIARLNAQIGENTQKQERLRRMELALLQAQINPHFLYNTLDTIIWLIEAGKPQEAEEMVSDLSAFFRHTLSKGKDIITLAEETEHIRSYLQIQQARYKDILHYTIDVAPDVLSAALPKLTLQPLVENALYHGVKLKRAMGCIYVVGHREGGDVLLQVTDDGPGITPERLEELRAAMEGGKRVGFGLATVDERLRLLFGPGYGLELSSRQGVGTTVTVRIPYQHEEAEGAS